MSVQVRDPRGKQADLDWIEVVYRDYLDDLMPLNSGVFPALGELGHREPDHLAHWYADPAAHPLLILRAGTPAGFALVARGGARSLRPAVDWRMAEFFVARDFRRLGVGRAAVRLIFDRFAGRWQVSEYQRNPAAVAFWRRTVSAYTSGEYRERLANGEVVQTFTSGIGHTDTTGT